MDLSRDTASVAATGLTVVAGAVASLYLMQAQRQARDTKPLEVESAARASGAGNKGAAAAEPAPPATPAAVAAAAATTTTTTTTTETTTEEKPPPAAAVAKTTTEEEPAAAAAAAKTTTEEELAPTTPRAGEGAADREAAAAAAATPAPTPAANGSKLSTVPEVKPLELSKLKSPSSSSLMDFRPLLKAIGNPLWLWERQRSSSPLGPSGWESARSLMPTYLADQLLPTPTKAPAAEGAGDGEEPAGTPKTAKAAAAPKEVKLTEFHLKLGLEREVGNYLATFGANLDTPGASFSQMGNIHVFDNAVGFVPSAGGRPLVTSLLNVTGVRLVPVMGLLLITQQPETLKIKEHSFQYLMARDALYKLLVKGAGLKQIAAGEARKKGRMATKAERAAAEEHAKNKGSISHYITSALRGPPQVTPPDLPTTLVDEASGRALYIHVHGASDLAAMDDGVSSDPYCEIKVCGVRQKTRTIEETLAPEWDEVFMVPLQPWTLLHKEMLTVTLFDWDLADTEALHDFLGWAELSLSSLELDTIGHKNEVTLPLSLKPGQSTSSFVKKYITMEGDIPITGEVRLTVWVGGRRDPLHKLAKAAQRAADTPDLPSGEVTCFAEPEMVVLCVDIDQGSVEQGRDLLAMDDNGMSDPYAKIKLAEGTPYEVAERTKYVPETRNPKWNHQFRFLVPLPLTDTLKVSVWDKDAITDDLIGRLQLPLRDLPVIKGLNVDQQVPMEWMALKDKQGSETTKEGERCGDIKMRAYLDNEYFHHPDDSVFAQECGRLEVDVLNLSDVKSRGRFYVVVKFDRLLAQTPVVEVKDTRKGAEWNRRLNFPVYDTASVLVLAVFDKANSERMVGKVRVRVAGLRGNTRYEKAVQLVAMDTFDALQLTGVLEMALTFKHPLTCGLGTGVLLRYTKSHIPEKNYWKPLPVLDAQRMEVRRRAMVGDALDTGHPRLPATVVAAMYDAAAADFSIRLMKATVARLQWCVAGMEHLGATFASLERWDRPVASVGAISAVCFIMMFPELILSLGLVGACATAVATYPSSFDRQMEYIGMDERLSVGELPDSTTTNTAEADPDAQEEDAAFNALNPLVNLKKQYDELVTLGQVAQLKMADVAGLVEAAQRLLNWSDPRATALMVVGCACAAVALQFIPLTAFRIKFGMAAGFAYVMRPPFMRDPTPAPPEIWMTRMPTQKDRIHF